MHCKCTSPTLSYAIISMNQVSRIILISLKFLMQKNNFVLFLASYKFFLFQILKCLAWDLISLLFTFNKKAFQNNHPSLAFHVTGGKEKTLYTMLSLKINFSGLQISESTMESCVSILCVYSSWMPNYEA